MAAELGNAYINIIPKAPGIKGKLEGLLGDGVPAGESTGRKMGSGLVSGFKRVVAGAAIGSFIKAAFSAGGAYEQLSEGAEKIFAGMDTSRIIEDAQNAYKNLNISANDYLRLINDVGASFAATMGAEAGYETAQRGLQAIADYASGTGKDVDLLSQKFTMISRATSSYMTIADQFSGVLPATSESFLEQAQAAGFLASSYTELSQVPINEYQAAIALMLEKGVADLNLMGNTALESANTLTGSFNAMAASWQNVMAALTTGEGLDAALQAFATTTGLFVENFLAMGMTLGGAVPEVLASVGQALIDNAPSLFVGGTEMALEILEGLLEGAWQLVLAVPDIFTQVGEAFLNNDWAGIGGDVIGGIIGGFLRDTGVLLSAVKDTVSNVIAWAKSLLGIASPSKVFRDEVGRWIPEGMAMGITSNMQPVKSSVDIMAQTATSEYRRAAASGSRQIQGIGGTAPVDRSTGQKISVVVRFSGALSQLARVLKPEIDVVTEQEGPAFVN